MSCSHDEEAMKRIAATIGAMFDKVTNRKPGENVSDAEEYAKVGDAEAQKIQAAIGLDIHGYVHFISAFEILHALNRHGEKSNDPLPITKADFERIYDVITNYDEIVYEDNTGAGLPGILYKKRVNGYIFVVEEYRQGKGKRKRLAFKTMYKTRKKRSPMSRRAILPGLKRQHVRNAPVACTGDLVLWQTAHLLNRLRGEAS